ncbi:hypothetical protein [Pseudomonas sp. EpS/L25]|uniref:hypothetical protein n=1 Tax=Pseudomonas sp. EpS/L25 TaxID=1749078 RepID=UPI0007440AAA|nr:hypothetical protein [Pseudomonas sp. EpS/L25]KUM43702.1 hypothetical protein AR540_18120 [Pseudomonas sp. EpS/L25]
MSWILTATGRRLDLTGSMADDIDPLDLARGLSRACRFAGQTTAFYSVAQHSVLASYHVPPEDALPALLHDAAEAYLGDLTGPLKRLLVSYHQALLTSAADVAGMEPASFIEKLGYLLPMNWTMPVTTHSMGLHANRPFYHQLERHLLGLVAERFDISKRYPASVAAIDLRLLATERRDLMPRDEEVWECLEGIEPLRIRIDPWSAETAELKFLQRLAELTDPPTMVQALPSQAVQGVASMTCIEAQLLKAGGSTR